MAVTANQVRALYNRASGLGDDGDVRQIDLPPPNPVPVTEGTIIGWDYQYGQPIYGPNPSPGQDVISKWIASGGAPTPKPVTPTKPPTIQLVPAGPGTSSAGFSLDPSWLLIGGAVVLFIVLTGKR